MSTTSTQTQSTTYTAIDVARVMNQFAADFDMYAQSTGCRTRENVKAVTADVMTMARAGYLSEINLSLVPAGGGLPIRATKYEVKADGSLSNGATPGNSLWPYTPGGTLYVTVVYTQRWWALTDGQRLTFTANLQRPWGTSSADLSFPNLARSLDRNYVSNGYGIQKYTFN